ncbi:MAG: glycosyltransferase family 2 protein [Ferruginibacter sp.]
MEKVIAVVVSYNRQVLLSECITALRNQTRRPDAILVVNNGSTDNTEKWLSEQDDIFFITQSNTGSGGGFNTGISHAYKLGYAWIWCMDDDGYPKTDALENLLAHEAPVRSLMNCAVINKEDKKSFVWKTGLCKTIDEVKEPVIEGIGHPFNGTLIHRAIVEKVGVPKAAFFLWGDESEYYYRIVKKHNIPVFTVTSSIHYHPSASFSYKKDWDYNSSWKMYYYVRNRFHIHNAKFKIKQLALLHYLFFIMAFAGIIIFYQKTNKIKKLYAIVNPATDAFTNNFTATPSSIIASLAKNEKPQKLFLTPMRYLMNIFLPSQPTSYNRSAA